MVGDWEDGGMVKGRWIYKDGSIFSGAFRQGVQPVSLSGLELRSLSSYVGRQVTGRDGVVTDVECMHGMC